MTRLVGYYDAGCGLCSRLVKWLEKQRQLVPLECLPKPHGVTDLAVVADNGDVWIGDSAWLIVLWALDDFRDWSYRLARPELLPMARQAFAVLSRNRNPLSSWLGLTSDEELAGRLRTVELPGCAL
jgi:predicted DCC family thiol-disulfide oxidoreductase YuxK